MSSPFLETRGLRMEYTRRNLWSREVAVALDSVAFHIDEGTATGLAGASGAGKSTLACCLAGIARPTRGQVLYRGHDVWRLGRSEMLAFRRNVQLVSQDAAGSINPRFPAAVAVSEPLRIAGSGTAQERRRRAIELMQEVGLPAGAVDRPALEFSGGQRRRLAIARALAARPEMMIFDEAFSGLDEATQTSILSLLAQLQHTRRLTYLFVSHDLGLLARACHEIAVMHRGTIVERASIRKFLETPTHAYSRELVEAIPPVRFL